MLEKLLGPRVPSREMARHRARYLLPTLLLLLASGMLLGSTRLPYWRLELQAPQYPGGLAVTVFVDHTEGDMHEIDGLNHYIGMRPLDQAARWEREVGLEAIMAMAVLVLLATFLHNRLAVVMTVPGLLFPAIFLADLGWWLWYFGTHLDPHAPLSSSIKPFVPPVLGAGKVGQFQTVATPEAGLWLALLASLVMVAGLYFHWRAYRPLCQPQEDPS